MMRVPLSAVFLTTPIAHRAYHSRKDRRPENSLGALHAAIVAGYGVEIDLQLSKDGHAVVFHDEKLDRLTDVSGWVRDATFAELQNTRLKDCDDAIPSLAQVLALVAGRVPLLIEIKDQTDQMAQTDGTLEAATATALLSYAGPLAVMSFNPHSVMHMARLAPGIARGLTTAAFDPQGWAPLDPLTCDVLREIPDYDRTMSSFISHEADDLSRPRVGELRRMGAAILTWTIRTPEQEHLARQIAQNITFENYAAPLLS
jgi:glycerophosphoryl diester phosphodiesterase